MQLFSSNISIIFENMHILLKKITSDSLKHSFFKFFVLSLTCPSIDHPEVCRSWTWTLSVLNTMGGIWTFGCYLRKIAALFVKIIFFQNASSIQHTSYFVSCCASSIMVIVILVIKAYRHRYGIKDLLKQLPPIK